MRMLSFIPTQSVSAHAVSRIHGSETYKKVTHFRLAPKHIHRQLDRQPVLFHLSYQPKMAVDLKSTFHMATASLALLLMIIGILSPGWLVMQSGNMYKSDKVTVSLGLWYVVVCTTLYGGMRNCLTLSMDEVAQGGGSSEAANGDFGGLGMSYVELNIESAMAMTCILVALFLVVYRHLRKPFSKRMATAVSVMLMLSACFTFILVGKMGRTNSVVSDLLTMTSGAELLTPYSIVVAAIGGCLAMFEAIFMFVQIFKGDQAHPGMILNSGARMDSTGYPIHCIARTVPNSPSLTGDQSPIPPIHPHPSEFTDKNVLIDA